MMMRKRLALVGMAVIIGAAMGLSAWAQGKGGPTDVGPLGEEMCCRDGVPQIPPGQECVVLHMVDEGENLHMLSAYYYGDARAWRRIYDLNSERIKNPNIIKAGMVLKVTVPPCWSPRYDRFDFLEMERKRNEAFRKAKEQALTKKRTTVENLEAPTINIVTPGKEEEEQPPAPETSLPPAKPPASAPTEETPPPGSATPPSAPPAGGGG
jgi:hypothetical protein